MSSILHTPSMRALSQSRKIARISEDPNLNSGVDYRNKSIAQASHPCGADFKAVESTEWC